MPAMGARFWSLRLRLLGLVLLMVVPWLLLVVYTQADERKAAIESVNDDALRLIRIVTTNQATQIEAARQVLTAFARLPQLHTKDAAACSAFLAEMLKAYPLYLNIALADSNGNLFCSALPFKGPINVADRAYFKMALEMHGFAIGDYQIGRITKVPAINYALPLLSRAGEVEGVVFVVQNLNWLTTALANVEFPPGAILVVTDRNGTVLARMPDPGDWIGKVLPERAGSRDRVRPERRRSLRSQGCARRRPLVGPRSADCRERSARDHGHVRGRSHSPMSTGAWFAIWSDSGS